VGLKSVVLTNRQGITRNKRKQELWSRNRKVQLADCLGSYSSSTKSTPGAVWLSVDNNTKSGIPWFRWVAILRYLVQGDVFYHGIGHHIHTEHRPIHEGREKVAEDWSKRLMNFIRKHYGYIYPFLPVLARVALPIFKGLKGRA
jgi:hypothetical protein